MRRYTIPAALMSLAASSAAGNDATAELGVGGLQMVYNSAIAVVSEDLYISTDEVRVAYRFRNITDQPVTVTVAFPLPALDATVWESLRLDLANPNSENYVDFELAINGKPVIPSVYSRASALGVDRTDVLRAAALPLNPAAFDIGLDDLAPATIGQLHRLGLIVVEDWGMLPSWRFESALYWEMTFPVGQEVLVEHRYQPVVGYGFFGDLQLVDAVYIDRFCMDDNFIVAAARMIGDDPAFGFIDEQRIEYLLTPAANWESNRHLSPNGR